VSFNIHKPPSTEQYNKCVKQNPEKYQHTLHKHYKKTITYKDMGVNRGLNTHVIDGIVTRCDGRTRQNQWKMKSGSVMAVTSTAAQTNRVTNFSGGRDTRPPLAAITSTKVFCRCGSDLHNGQEEFWTIHLYKTVSVQQYSLGCLV
jgi:hypothetical protein